MKYLANYLYQFFQKFVLRNIRPVIYAGKNISPKVKTPLVGMVAMHISIIKAHTRLQFKHISNSQTSLIIYLLIESLHLLRIPLCVPPVNTIHVKSSNPCESSTLSALRRSSPLPQKCKLCKNWNLCLLCSLLYPQNTELLPKQN